MAMFMQEGETTFVQVFVAEHIAHCHVPVGTGPGPQDVWKKSLDMKTF